MNQGVLVLGVRLTEVLAILSSITPRCHGSDQLGCGNTPYMWHTPSSHPLSSPQQSTIIKNMKAIRVHQFGGPEVLQYEVNAPIPKLEPGSILLRVKAVGINPVDTYIRSGAYARKPKLPYVPGHDCAGVVEEVGPEVSGFKRGDRVYAGRALSGSYAEYALVSAPDVQPLPAEVSFEQGAAIAVPYYTAYR